MNIKDEIKKMEETASAKIVYRLPQAIAVDAMKIIKKLEEALEIQDKALKEISACVGRS